MNQRHLRSNPFHKKGYNSFGLKPVLLQKKSRF